MRKNEVVIFHDFPEFPEEFVPRGGLGRLAAWHLPHGTVGPPATWAATSNVEVGQTTYPVNRRSVWREPREGSEGQSHKEEKGGKKGVECGGAGDP